MKYFALLSLLGACLPVGSFALSSADDKTPETGIIEEIVAKVNGDIVTRTELGRGRRELEKRLKAGGLNGGALQQEMQNREKDLLKERIDELLLVQKGKEIGINVDPEISKYLAEIQRQLGIADPEKFQAAVRQEVGMPFEDYKQDMKNDLLRQRVIGQEVGSRIQMTRAELTKYYEEHKKEFVRQEQVFLREIFVSTEGKDAAGKAAAEKKAKDLVARARKGEKFPELARDNSDSQSAKQGGDIGAWKKGELEKALEDAVFTHDRGYVSDPIVRTSPTPGFLILKVEERFKSGQAEFEEVENEVREKLYGPRMQPAIKEYLTRLRQNAFLEIKEGYVDTGAAPGKDTSWKDPAALKPETVTKAEVAAQTRRKRLLWLVPIPGTSTTKDGTSSSR
jgi:parvulin-like peptidyl-prolyl isomerase